MPPRLHDKVHAVLGPAAMTSAKLVPYQQVPPPGGPDAITPMTRLLTVVPGVAVRANAAWAQVKGVKPVFKPAYGPEGQVTAFGKLHAV